MKLSWKYILSASLLVLLSVLFTSCATKPKTEYITITETEIQTVTETEYVPVYVDLNDTIKTVVDQKPDNSTYVVLTGDQLKTSWDVMYNSWVYQTAWLDWQAYAELLEDTLYICRDKCADPAALTTETTDVIEDTEPIETVETAEPKLTTEGVVSTPNNEFEIPTIG